MEYGVYKDDPMHRVIYWLNRVDKSNASDRILLYVHPVVLASYRFSCTSGTRLLCNIWLMHNTVIYNLAKGIIRQT